jgi:RNA polymerase sigma factor (sigma-70 family)
MSEFYISQEEIEHLLAEPIIEHEGTDPLLAQPPIISDRFRFAGISLSKALAHPVLGPALEDFHDRLHWSKDAPSELGAEGIELFLLNHAFFHAGHPIISMPPPRVAAGIIWDQTMRLLDPRYRGAVEAGSIRPDLSPVLIGNTIHGSRTLLRNCQIVQRQIVKAFGSRRHAGAINGRKRLHLRLRDSMGNSSGAGDVQFGEFVGMAESALSRAADRYDPRRASFPTYAHHRLRGVAIDWWRSSPPTKSVDPNPEDRFDTRIGLVHRVESVVGSYYPGGQKSAIPVPSDDWLAEGLVDLEGERLRLDKIAAATNLTERQRVILAHLRCREDGRPYLAKRLGITEDHLKVEISRLKKKLMAAVTKYPNPAITG